MAIMKDITWKNAKAYFIGNYRYFLWNRNYLMFLMRTHIEEQIIFRVLHMDQECFDRGACKLCGCRTIQLQMANKVCPGDCYPAMMNKKQWKKFKQENNIKLP